MASGTHFRSLDYSFLGFPGFSSWLSDWIPYSCIKTYVSNLRVGGQGLEFYQFNNQYQCINRHEFFDHFCLNILKKQRLILILIDV